MLFQIKKFQGINLNVESGEGVRMSNCSTLSRAARDTRWWTGDAMAIQTIEPQDQRTAAALEALHLALAAAGMSAGDEVITVAHTAVATAVAIRLCNATPVFVDIAADGFNIDPDAVDAAVTERTRAVLPVHLFGDPAPLAAILAVARQHDLRVIEDCAQAFERRYERRRHGTGLQ